jgi:60 kDa SS-A/Ro ribonucleoprotein
MSWTNSIRLHRTRKARRIAKITNIGLLKPLSEASKLIVNRLTDQQYITKSRAHPMGLPSGIRCVRPGSRVQGVTHLESGSERDGRSSGRLLLYLAFPNVVPTGKSFYIGLDISGSMSSEFTPGSGITCVQAGAALAIVTARTEKNHAIYGFASGGNGGQGFGGRWGGSPSKMVDLKITAKDTLESAQRKAAAHTMGGTSIPQ